jgi:uncharacterized protein
MSINQQQQGFYPGRANIEAYGNGGFRFAGMSHQGSILCLPSGIHAWTVSKPEDITEDSLKPFFDEAQNIELLFIGTGKDIAILKPEIKKKLIEAGLKVEVIPTGPAIRTYNILFSEDRQVAAALIVV